ncbi:MAG TPA: hypothetical protein VI588_01260, partial [Candidatus Gracilibacteria bacterium]|nr:hypothetical protein [Candidatus Gracilibacteria bacterium]
MGEKHEHSGGGHGHGADHGKKAHEHEKRYTHEEREYYEASVEDAAQRASGADHAKVEKLVWDIVESSDVHEDLKLRMHRDVMARLEDMRRHAQSDREKKVLDQYEGYVKSVDGKFRPAGIDQKFKVTVRPEAGWNVSDLTEHGYEGYTSLLYMKGAWWKTGKVFDRVFGRTVDSDSFHNIIMDVEKANEDVEKLKRELELLRAAEKSVGQLISLSASGFLTRVRSRGITSIIGSSFASAGDFFSGIGDKYWGEDTKRREQVSIDIAKKIKDLKEKESLRDATLKKLDQLREQGRVLFDKAFKPEVDVLMAQKAAGMPDAEYQKNLKALRDKVRKWSEKTGFAHMEVFLDEMLGVPASKEVPLSPLEVKQRDANVSKFLKDIIGRAAKQEEVAEFTDILLQKLPDLLRKIGKKDFGRGADGENNVAFLQFLVQGKYKDMKLPEGRRLKPTPENLTRYLLLSLQYKGKTFSGTDADLDHVLREFADHWTGVDAEHFDDVFDMIAAGREPQHGEVNETEKEVKEKDKLHEIGEAAKKYWSDVTGDEIGKEDHEKLMVEVKKDTRRY